MAISYVRCASSVVRHQQLFQRTSLKLLVGFLTKLGMNDPYIASLIIAQMVPVHCITRSNELKIDSQTEILKNLLV